MRLAQVLTVSVLTLAMTAEVYAERRPGLGGKYAARNMTAAQGSLSVLAGPTSAQALGTGGMFAAGGPGFTYNRFVLGDDNFELDLSTGFFTLGAAYGITPELEAGLMIPLLIIQPEGGEADALQTLPVFVTYAMDMGNFDVGVRVTANIPIEEDRKFSTTIGFPALFRFGGNSRVDTGLFLPLTPGGKLNDDGEEAMRIDLNIPVRFTQSVTPKIFVGLETGLTLIDLDTDMGAIPLSFHGGYTLLAGGNVIDIAASFGFPGFISLAEEADNPGTDLMQIAIGTNVQMKF